MSVTTNPAITANPSLVPSKLPRMLSVDVLRGLTIAFMILVNNNGDEHHAYWPLKHAAWNGFTPTDLVFPTFLFLVGVSTVFSTASRLAQGATKASLFLHTLRRAVILFLLGLLVNSFPHFNPHTIRIYGVLPRIAICYLIVATFYLITPGWRNKVAVAVAALAGYWIIMRFIPVPGYGLPGRDIPLLDPDRNIVAWLDRQIFSAPHLYERTRDPEGILSTIPSIATAVFGLLTGIWLRTSRSLSQKAKGIAVAGLSGVILGVLWNFTFPINKKLWTSSYALFAGGLSLLLLALSIWIIDLRRKSSSTESRTKPPAWLQPLMVLGTNSIFAYVLSELLASTLDNIRLSAGGNVQQWCYRTILHAIPDASFASLLYSLAFVAVCWLPTYVLYRQRIFIKI
jgi:predicted acyltransferase